MSLSQWATTKPFANAGSYYAVAYGNGEFVVVGNLEVLRSKDAGATWTSGGITPARVLQDVAFGDGVFAAVGLYKYRWDGTSWTQAGAAETGVLRAIAHGTVPLNVPHHGPPPVMGLFVAVGDGARIRTSPDGLTWTPVTHTATTDDIIVIAYGNQRFVAGTENGSILTSVDGVNWTLAATLVNKLLALTYGNGAFVGVDLSNRALKSVDGSSWTVLTTTGLGNTPKGGLVFFWVVYVLVGAYGSIHTSPDGVVWTARTSGSMQSLGGVAYGGNRFVAVGGGGTGGTSDIVRSDVYPSLSLLSLTCSTGPLTPAFDPLKTSYAGTATTPLDNVTVTAAAEEPNVTVWLKTDGRQPSVLAPNIPSTPIALGRGRRFTISVTGPNAVKDYTINVPRYIPPFP